MSVRLYRATRCGPEAFFGALSWWAREEDDAREYLYNPGYGGPCLYVGVFDVSYVLDLTFGEPYYGWDDSKAIVRIAEELHGSDGDASIDFIDEMSGTYVHDILEKKDVFLPLSRSYDWVKIYDTFPEGAETWMRLVPITREEQESIERIE